MVLLMYHQEVAGLRQAAQAQNNVMAAGRALATDKGQRIGDGSALQIIVIWRILRL